MAVRALQSNPIIVIGSPSSDCSLRVAESTNPVYGSGSKKPNLLLQEIWDIDRSFDPSLLKLVAASELGDARAKFNLGVFYETGQGGLAPDKAKARELYEAASALGDARAKFNLGVFYETGQGGLEQNKVRAFLLYQESAMGIPESCLNSEVVYQHIFENYTEILKNIKPSPKPDNHNSIIMLEEFKDNDRVCFLKKTDSHYSMFFLDEVYDPSNHQLRFTFNPETRGPLVFIKPTQLPRAKNIVDAEG